MMPESNVFHFRKFSILQQHTTWKVGTDSVLLGAWTELHPKVNCVLDIGAGAGVLSLMIAQRHADAKTTAVEIDKDTAQELNHNVKTSDWSDRINVHQVNIHDFVREDQEKFDLVISNPPYFRGGLRSTDEKRARARSGTAFDLHDLPKLANDVLKIEGTIGVVMPARHTPEFIAESNISGFYVFRRLDVSHVERRSTVLTLLQLKRQLGPVFVDQLALYTDCGRTSKFERLCDAFFLSGQSSIKPRIEIQRNP